MSAGLHTVHVRINDPATGQPTPVRVHFSNPDGKYFAPLGRLTDFALEDYEDVGGNLLLGEQRFAYIDGTCEIRLPAGPMLLEVHKGPEYTPSFLQTVLAPGKLALRHQVERWTDLRRDRWYSGDIRAHALTPQAAWLEAAAEDLAVVNLLAEEYDLYTLFKSAWPRGLPLIDVLKLPTHQVVSNILAFSGQRPALEMPGHLVVVNTHNCHDQVGSLALLNCHRVVYPLATKNLEEWPGLALADLADQCHRKRGLVVWTEMLVIDEEDEGWLWGEPLADLLLGKVDALEATGADDLRKIQEYWYRIFNCGCRVALVGGSGKRSNRVPLGSLRTYARLQPGEEFSYPTWIEAVRAGRTFITNGPLLSFTANGQDPGAVVDLPSLDQPVQLAVSARSFVPFDELELLLNGEVILQMEAKGSPASAGFEGSVTLPSAGWLAARCTGSRQLPVSEDQKQPVAAHTSPIYVQVGGRPGPVAAESRAFLLGQLDQMTAWAERQGGSGNGHRPERLVEVLQSARRVLAPEGQ